MIKKYVVYVQLDREGDKFGAYTGIEHDEYCDAVKEMKEALSEDEVYHAWIREEEPLGWTTLEVEEDGRED